MTSYESYSCGIPEDWSGFPQSVLLASDAPSERGKETSSIELSQELLLKIDRLVASYQLSHQSVFYASFALAVARCTRSSGMQLVLASSKEISIEVELEETPVMFIGRIAKLTFNGHSRSTLIVLEWEGLRPKKINLRWSGIQFPGWLALQLRKVFLHFLSECCQRPDQALSQITLPPQGTTDCTFSISAGDVKDFPWEEDIWSRFDECAKNAPHSRALILFHPERPSRTISYQELTDHVDRCTAMLQSYGLKQGEAVAVCRERDEWFVATLLSIFRLGLVYVPLELTYPASYQYFILSDSEAKLLVTHPNQPFDALPDDLVMVAPEEFSDFVSSAILASQLIDIKAPALIMYTSGSTGKPKGVVHCQRQLINRLYWMWQEYPYDPGDIQAQKSPCSVMPSMWELLGGLLSGTATALLPGAVSKDPLLLSRAIEHVGISWVTLIPSVLRVMLKLHGISMMCKSLRVVIVGGEHLSLDLYDEFRKNLKHTLLINDFGATEVNTILHAPLHPGFTPGRIPGGKPIANVQAFILSEQRELLPHGFIGELCVGGLPLALGYHNRPAKTASQFFSHTIPGLDEFKLYATGDLAIMDSDGCIHVLGRADYQAKISGFRVEPEQIENTLCRHPKISNAAITALPNKEGISYLKAFIEPQNGTQLVIDELRSWLRKRLPAHLVPAQFSFVDRLPRLPNGKKDRHRLQSEARFSKSIARPPVKEASGRLIEIAATCLDVGVDSLDTDRTFESMGFNSLLALNYITAVNEEFKTALSFVDFYDHPTIGRLSQYMGRGETVLSGTLSKQAVKDHDVAIIGMSGQFPGAEDLNAFWSLINSGDDAISEIPTERWGLDGFYDPQRGTPGTSYSKWGGFLTGVDQFDPEFFNLSKAEARMMDPQQRLALMECWRCLEDAGYASGNLSGKNVAVYLGAKKGEYQERVHRKNAPNSDALLGNDPAIMASRLAYFLNLKGPVMSVDTACSSSMTALYLACQNLISGESEMALAGGVCVTTMPEFYMATSQLGVFSPSGKCRTFDDDADGFVHGEGVGFVLLKPLVNALQDGNQIHGVIKGIAMNHDGTTNGIAAPSAMAQANLIRQLYLKRDIDPETIDYVEAHGTGTALGDPIELQGLSKAFQHFTSLGQYCAIGSVKTHIGHATAASGIAGLLKMILALKHRKLPPTLNFKKPNKHIDFSDSPFYVNTESRFWVENDLGVRRAAISSLGMGGTNLHCIVEEAPAQHSTPSEERLFPVVCSALTESSLSHWLEAMQDWCHEHESDYELGDVAFSLFKGRKLFPHRQVFMVSTIKQLAQHIGDVLADQPTPTAGGNTGSALIDKIVSGELTDSKLIFGTGNFRMLSLPTYRFDLQSYWVEHEWVATKQGAVKPDGAEPIQNRSLSEFLQEALSESLGTQKLDPNKALSAYGFDSVRAIDLKYRLDQYLGEPVPLKGLVQASTLSDILRAFAKYEAGSPVKASYPVNEELELTDQDAPFALTDLQSAYFVGRHTAPYKDKVGCHTYLEFECPHLDVVRFRNAWAKLVAHHAMLRATVLANGRQQVRKEAPPTFILTKVLPEDDTLAMQMLSGIREQMSHKLYLPGDWPLWEVVITSQNEHFYRVHISMDSWVVDAKSAQLLYVQLQNLYDHPNKELTPMNLSFRKVLDIKKQTELPIKREKDLAYWKNKLVRLSRSRFLPLSDSPSLPAEGYFKRTRFRRKLPLNVTEQLQSQAEEWGVTPTALVLTIFSEHLMSWAASEQVAFVMTHPDRPPVHQEVDSIVGPFTSTSIFIAESTADTFKERVKNIQEQLWEDLDHLSVSGIEATRALVADGHSLPEIPVVFSGIIADRAEGTPSWMDKMTWSVSQSPGTWLECQVLRSEGRIQVSWDLATALFPNGIAEPFFTGFIDSLCKAPAERIPRLPLVKDVLSRDIANGHGHEVPCTFFQRSYLIHQLSSNGARARVKRTWKMKNPDIDRLQEAFDGLMLRYPVLSAEITSRGTLLIPVSGQTLPIIVEHTKEHVGAHKNQNKSNIEVRLTGPENGTHRLTIAIDMIVADGLAILLFYDQFFDLYSGKSLPQNSGTYFLETQLRKRKAKPHAVQVSDYWKQKFLTLKKGPALPRGSADVNNNQRISTTCTHSAILHHKCGETGITVSSLVATLLLDALALSTIHKDFALPVLHFKSRQSILEGFGEMGDFTGMAWVNYPEAHTNFTKRLELVQQVLEKDVDYRDMHWETAYSQWLREQAETASPFPVIFTNCLGTAFKHSYHQVITEYSGSFTPGLSLDVFAYETPEGIHLDWDFSTATVDEAFVFQLAETVNQSLNKLANYGHNWEEFEIPGPAEKTIPEISTDGTGLLQQWNKTAKPYRQDLTLHEWVDEVAIQQPDAIALISDSGNVTYEMLRKQSNRVARYLLNQEMGPAERVGVCMNRTHDIIISLLGVLKAGAAFVPLQFDNPVPRLKSMVKTAGINSIINHKEHEEIVQEICENSISWEDMEAGLFLLDGESAPDIKTHSKDLAYVIFTSGSTGEPKGVAVTHRPVVNLIEWVNYTFSLGPEDTVLFVNPLGFDLSIYDVFGLLACGGKIRIVSDKDRKDPMQIAGMLVSEDITFWNSAPAALQQLIPFLKLPKQARKDRLKLVFLSGDWIPLTLPGVLKSHFSQAQVVGLGGATEATVWSNYFIIDQIDPDWKSIPYGRPIQNARYYILNDELQPCLVGQEGHLFIGGECLSEGYINAPELTKKQYLPDLFVNDPKGIMYRTGDMAKYFPDGNIEFLGRRDHQVKINGHRIELAEIENAIRKSGYDQAMALLREDLPGNKYIIAFVVGDQNESLSAGLGQFLPPYMIPQRIVFLNTIPVSENGKVDRKYLETTPIDQIEESQATDGALSPSTTMASGDLPEFIRKEVADILGVDVEGIDPDENIGHLGFNSLHYTLLSAHIIEETGVEINPALFFRHTTVTEIATWLHEEHKAVLKVNEQGKDIKGIEPENQTSESPAQIIDSGHVPAMGEFPVAVIGMAGRMPQANDLNEFWQNLSAQKDCTETIPQSRWDWRQYYGDPAEEGNKTDSTKGGFMEQIDSFDAAFFKISPREAKQMDPRQRLLLENTWHTLEDAGLDPHELRESATGLFIGATGDEYQKISLQGDHPMDGFSLSGTSRTILANRISYVFDWHGPSEVVDTACSSSLVAVHNAINALRCGDCDLAIAGGINLLIEPEPQIALSKIGMLSPDGACKTFDAKANGYVRGEGVGTVLLKPLDKALADGDHIHAVIRGSAINHGGKANSLTSPNPKAQIALLRSAFGTAQIDSRQLGYIETHGTGTPLGDPIEVEGLKEAFGKPKDEKWNKTCGLGSVKTNIGHLEAAAGIAGLLKTVLSIKHRQLPASLHLQELNPIIELRDSPFYIVDNTNEWKVDPSTKLMAGVSSFGFGGVNAHVVVEEAPLLTYRKPKALVPELILLSANDTPGLKSLVVKLVEFLSSKEQESLLLADVAFTLSLGRAQLKERLACVVSSVSELTRTLHQYTMEGPIDGFASDQLISGQLAQGHTKVNFDAPKEALPDNEELLKVAHFWVNGGLLPRNHAYFTKLGLRGRRIPLILYPFKKDRFWVDEKAQPALNGQSVNLMKDEQSFVYTGAEWYFAEHVIDGQSLLPGAVFVSLSLAAVSHTKFGKTNVLRNLSWVSPVLGERGKGKLIFNVLAMNGAIEFSWNHSIEGLECFTGKAYEQTPASEARLPAPFGPAQVTLSGRECYELFNDKNIRYGASLQVIDQWHYMPGRAEAELSSGVANGDSFKDLPILDGMLQAIAMFNIWENPSDSTLVPFAMEYFHCHSAIPTLGRVVMTTGSDSKTGHGVIRKFNALLIDRSDRIVVEMGNVTARPLRKKPIGSPRLCYFKQSFQPDEFMSAGSEEQHTALDGQLIVFDDAQLAAALRALGKRVIEVRTAEKFNWIDENTVSLDPANMIQARAFLDSLEKEHKWPETVCIPAYPEKPVSDHYQLRVLFSMLRAVLRRKKRTPLSLICTNLGNVNPCISEALEAFALSVHQEEPQVRITIISSDHRPGTAQQLAGSVLQCSNRKEAIHVRTNDWSDWETQKVELHNTKDKGSQISDLIRQESHLLITGGGGQLAGILVEALSPLGPTVSLLGRSEHNETLQKRLEASGSQVKYYQADLTDRQALSGVLAGIEQDSGPVTGVFHTAGELNDGLLYKQNRTEFLLPLQAKVNGLLLLEELLPAPSLDFLVLFSSLVAVTGGVGQSSYAYANRFLDAYATQKEQQRLQGKHQFKTRSIQWGLQANGGMKVPGPWQDELAKETGMLPMPMQEFLNALNTCLHSNENLVAVYGHQDKLKGHLSDGVTVPFNSEIPTHGK